MVLHRSAAWLLYAHYFVTVTQAGTVTDQNASASVKNISSAAVAFGVHQPQGINAVRYLYSSAGTWKAYTGLQYRYDYYNTTPAERARATSFANGKNPGTSPDKNNVVLWNLKKNVGSANGISFEQHNGKGRNGASTGQPLSQFWHDDNYLANIMALAYSAPQPKGLVVAPCRWSVLRGDLTNYPPQSTATLEGRILEGLELLARSQSQYALLQWLQLLPATNYTYDNNLGRFVYPGLSDAYLLGLFKILTDKLTFYNYGYLSTLIQHSISTRANLLATQQGGSLGWLGSSYINTQATAMNSIALGTGYKYSFEAGLAPMRPGPGGYDPVRYIISAVAGRDSKGTQNFGPYLNFPISSFTVDFFMRSSNPGSQTVRIDVNDRNINQVLASADIPASAFPSNNQWGRWSLSFNVQNRLNSLEFRVFWDGTGNLDTSAIRVR